VEIDTKIVDKERQISFNPLNIKWPFTPWLAAKCTVEKKTCIPNTRNALKSPQIEATSNLSVPSISYSEKVMWACGLWPLL